MTELDSLLLLSEGITYRVNSFSSSALVSTHITHGLSLFEPFPSSGGLFLANFVRWQPGDSHVYLDIKFHCRLLCAASSRNSLQLCVEIFLELTFWMMEVSCLFYRCEVQNFHSQWLESFSFLTFSGMVTFPQLLVRFPFPGNCWSTF